MTDFERTFLGCLFALSIGALMLTLALAILRHRPVVIAPKTAVGALTLPCLPVLIVTTVGSIVDSLNSDSTMLSLALTLSGLLEGLMLFGVIVIIAAQYFYLYNITETMLRDALHSALQKQGLPYIESEPGFFSRLFGVRISITVLEPKVSIKVIVTSGNAWMRIVGKRRIPNYKALITDFKQFLTANECGTSFVFGVIYIVGAITFIGMGIYCLIGAFV